jgi:hypothetical protein
MSAIDAPSARVYIHSKFAHLNVPASNGRAPSCAAVPDESDKQAPPIAREATVAPADIGKSDQAKQKTRGSTGEQASVRPPVNA